MRRAISIAVALSAALAIAQTGIAPGVSAQDVKPIRVVSEQAVKGFAFPESVAYGPRARALYVSEFGSELNPAEKDGKGRISKVSVTGEILNKPKGIWVAGSRLWVTNIDAVRVFDLKTRRGTKLALPGIQFANDPAVAGNVLYVGDNRADALYRVEPADFLEMSSEPKVTRVFQGESVNPNGLCPARDGLLPIAGFVSADQPCGIYAMSVGGEITTVARDLARLDGLYRMDDGTLLVTDWNSGSLLRWSAKGTETLAQGFKGPADFCVVPEAGGLLVIVPDPPPSELRLVRLAR